MVFDQGTFLDRIDYNMEAVVEHTKEGIGQLEKAERHQKNARPLKCIICLSITIFILLILKQEGDGNRIMQCNRKQSIINKVHIAPEIFGMINVFN